MTNYHFARDMYERFRENKEKVNRIEGVLKEMIRFLQEERDITEVALEP